MAMYSSSMATAFLLHFVRIAAGLTVRPHCQASCGSVDVPYPFGIGADCFLPGFEIVCLNGDSPVLTGTAHLSIQVLRLSVTPRPEALVTLRVAHQCYNSAGNVTDSYNGTVDLGQSSRVYRISDTANELFVLGCNTFVYTNSGYLRSENDFAHNAGCVATCVDSGSASDGACAGIGCCHVDIPPDLTDNRMYFTADDDDWSHAEQDYSPCDYAFIVERGNYTFRKDDLTSMPLDKAMPLRLDWAIRDEKGSSRSMSCAKAPVEAGYRCVSDHSVCVNSTNGPGYVCNCTQGYEGNPYLTHGCTNIDECAHPTKYPCDGVCKDTQGSYLCYCHPGYGSDDPRTQRCTPKFPLAAQICIGTIGGILVIAFMAFVIVIRKERQKMREFYEKNGGLTLEKGKFIKLFKKEELKPILKSGNVIGKGGFGEVYKGVVDNELVAVKKPIRGNVRENMQFANEVIIQSQVIHKNIVRLIGCCLEVDAPMLVYEFISKGSMDDILHRADNKELLSLDVRLNILAESAHGLAYMHSQAHTKILHGDVKPANILLDDNFVPKISDFGISRLIAIDNEHTANVIGDMTYMDPIYVQTGRLTEKSDVYSFGIVILEVISRKKATHSDNNSLVTSFLECHKEGKRATELFDKEIAATGDLELLDTLAKIAVDCLNLDVDQRPSMTDVVVRLLSILNRSRMT